MSYSSLGPFHRAKYTHLAPESEKLKEDLGKGFSTAWDVEDFPWQWIIFIQEIIVSFDKN